LATWVWCVGVLILVMIGAAIGIGWFFTHNTPATGPVAIGGSAEETQGGSTAGAAIATSERATRVTAVPLPTTTTNARRNYIDEIIPRAPVPLPIPAGHRRSLVNRISH